jgi:hypothetical protein
MNFIEETSFYYENAIYNRTEANISLNLLS